MLNNDQIVRCLREVAFKLKHDYASEDLHAVESNQRTYSEDDLTEFKRDLVEAGNKMRMLFMPYRLERTAFEEFFTNQTAPILTFVKKRDHIFPVLITPEKRKKFSAIYIESEADITEEFSSIENLPLHTIGLDEVEFFAVFTYESPVSMEAVDGKAPTPIKRLLRLLGTEKKEIFYILFYAIIIGLIGLVIPLGIQTTVELISGGVFFSSVYVLITLVILGVLLSGGLQVVQISLVEFLQRRIFTKASLEFAFRIPRIRMEALQRNYAPELINRFFDVVNIQKGLPKLLIDLSSAIIQILFGLLLISLYHPFFVFFGLVLLLMLVLIFTLTGPRGLSSSIEESKYKYKVAHWLEELGRALHSFKLAGSTDLPIRKTDYNVNNYLKNRKVHFRVLVTQFSFIVIFKALITGGLLIMGTLLVVDRQITLGQFVASEIVIILILNAVEKIIMYMDVVYDLLTAVDKVAQVTDLPIEKTGGLDFPVAQTGGFHVRTKDLKYRYSASGYYALKGIDLDIKPGETVCITGQGNSGKTTLMNLLTGLYTDYEGVVTINNYSLRDIDLTHLRDQVAKNISQEDLFDGTLLENITLGRRTTTVHDAIYALEQVGLNDVINALPKGLDTPIISGGKGLTKTVMHKLILARCLAKKPQLLVLNDFFIPLAKADKLELLKCITQPNHPWTVIIVSKDPLIMSACDRVFVLEEGKVQHEGTMEELTKKELLKDLIA
ncbi:MAG: ATP-binding cassette domain-containing protein [Cytophagales bacterium]|jgi:ABC-type bacteriocin/lantibiotic exporter with double-glycine peptidase domain|nr:ATP-binding cassette domain-containing protein [Cytophagales bacterium]